VSDLLGASDSGQKPPSPNFHHCKQCGALTVPMPILDSRHGKTYRLLRCVSCEKMSWNEEQ
jgi:hypothetical protein